MRITYKLNYIHCQLLILLIVLLNFISCQTKNENNTIDNLENWESFIVETKFQKIQIFNNSDSILYTNTVYKNGVGDIPPKYELDSIEKGTIILNNSEREKLISHIVNLITQPTITDIHATDYVGNVKFVLDRHNMKISCQYISVGDWSEISKDTKQVYEILNKKLKLSTQ